VGISTTLISCKADEQARQGKEGPNEELGRGLVDKGEYTRQEQGELRREQKKSTMAFFDLAFFFFFNSVQMRMGMGSPLEVYTHRGEVARQQPRHALLHCLRVLQCQILGDLQNSRKAPQGHEWPTCHSCSCAGQRV